MNYDVITEKKVIIEAKNPQSFFEVGRKVVDESVWNIVSMYQANNFPVGLMPVSHDYQFNAENLESYLNKGDFEEGAYTRCCVGKGKKSYYKIGYLEMRRKV